MLLVDEPRIDTHGIRRASAAIAVESLKKLPGAIDVQVKALRAGEPSQLKQIEQITEGQYVRAKCLNPAKTPISYVSAL